MVVPADGNQTDHYPEDKLGSNDDERMREPGGAPGVEIPDRACPHEHLPQGLNVADDVEDARERLDGNSATRGGERQVAASCSPPARALAYPR